MYPLNYKVLHQLLSNVNYGPDQVFCLCLQLVSSSDLLLFFVLFFFFPWGRFC